MRIVAARIEYCNPNGRSYIFGYEELLPQADSPSHQEL